MPSTPRAAASPRAADARPATLVDEAAAGERIVIERAGQPVAALVPLADLELVDPERRRARRLAAIDDIAVLARRRPFPPGFNAAAIIRAQRDGRVVAPTSRPSSR
jgi:prevent-host-death family protein